MLPLAWTALGLPPAAWSQQTIGTVPVRDASVSGKPQINDGQAVLLVGSSVTAHEHTADVALARGGTVRVCQTSGVTLSSGSASSAPAGPSPPAEGPLMLALDRGAIELKLNAITNDIILTPDLRFAVSHSGPIDLRVRVTSNGDTCVEQREAKGPTLLLSDTFGEMTYEVHGGQHLLFEHGNLREVVDHESSPCGCPEAHPVSLAQAALGASSEHPFPAAESAGLAPIGDVPQAPPGTLHTQVDATVGYDGTSSTTSEPAPMPIARPDPAGPSQSAKEHGFGHSVKRFFKRLFGGS